GEQKISNIFQFLPKEDFYSVTDPDAVDKLVKDGKIADNDVVYEDGLPVMVRSFPMVETKGRVIKEKFINNFPVPEGAKVIETGRSGRLAARPENIHPVEWLRNNGIPDVYVDSSAMFGNDEALDRQKHLDEATFMLNQNDRKKQRKEPDAFNEDEIFEDLVKVLRRNPRKLLKKNTDSGARISSGVDSKDVLKQMDEELAMQQETTAQSNQATQEQQQTSSSQQPPASPGAGQQQPQTMQSMMQGASQDLSNAGTGA
ncbi:hypothetical protein KW797_00475, partial [Candidatus Parcubacteria bacterium]|nr:hypothetical protein [Candidatus Parcubacteria bacterium]